MSTLLNYFSNHPPDLEKRKYQKSLGFTDRFDEANDKSQADRILVVPRPGPSRMFSYLDTPDGNLTEKTLTNNLVSPLLWIPGVLRTSGSWSVAMKDTIHGEAYITCDTSADQQREGSVVLDTVSSMVPSERGIQDAMQELERAVRRQANVNQKLVHKFQEQYVAFRKMTKSLVDEDKRKREETVKEVLRLSSETIKKLNQELNTVKIASNVRARRAYAQDNFLSTYSKAMLTIKDHTFRADLMK